MAASVVTVPKRDFRLPMLAAVVLAVGVLGYLLDRIAGGDPAPVAKPAAATAPIDLSSLLPAAPPAEPTEEVPEAVRPEGDMRNGHARAARELRSRGRKEIEAKQFDAALNTLDQALRLKPDDAEAYALGGYALLGKRLPDNARTAFRRAIDRRPDLADAYFGLGYALEELGDPEGALGAMRAYLHLTKVKDPYNRTVTQARSAIWEIESRLGRGPWGETKGIPPGLSERDVRRDGYGVGMITINPDGTAVAAERPADHKKKPPAPSLLPKPGN